MVPTPPWQRVYYGKGACLYYQHILVDIMAVMHFSKNDYIVCTLSLTNTTKYMNIVITQHNNLAYRYYF